METNIKLNIIENIIKLEDGNLLNEIDFILKNQKRLTIDELSDILIKSENEALLGELIPHEEIVNMI